MTDNKNKTAPTEAQPAASDTERAVLVAVIRDLSLIHI